MVIDFCITCGKKRVFPCEAERKRKSATHKCRQCFIKSNFHKGEKHPNWKGGYFIRSGYKFIYSPNHPHKNKLGYVREHRLVIEKSIGRYLNPEEIIHHVNGIRDDNRIENLKLVTKHNHMKFHPHIKIICKICGKKHLARGYCDHHYWLYFLKDHRKNSNCHSVI